MPEENDAIGKGSSCCVDGNNKSVNPIKETGAGGTGSGEGVSSSATSSPSSASKNQGKSCKGCLYYSSTFKSNSRNPLCLGLSRSLPQGSRSIFSFFRFSLICLFTELEMHCYLLIVHFFFLILLL